MRDYRKASAKVMRHRERFRAIEEFRRAAIEQFEKVGSVEMTGYTAAYMLRELKLTEPGSER